MEGLIWIHENLHGFDWLNKVVKFITALGDTAIIWIALAVFMLFFKNTRRASIVMLISLAIGYIINDFVLKNIFERVRPFDENNEFKVFLENIGMELPSGFSFPSGHTFSSFNCAVVLMCFNKKFGYFTLPLASIIAMSRIYLCVHYPTDVLVGAILGIVTALIVYYTYKVVLRMIKKYKREYVRSRN